MHDVIQGGPVCCAIYSVGWSCLIWFKMMQVASQCGAVCSSECGSKLRGMLFCSNCIGA